MSKVETFQPYVTPGVVGGLSGYYYNHYVTLSSSKKYLLNVSVAFDIDYAGPYDAGLHPFTDITPRDNELYLYIRKAGQSTIIYRLGSENNDWPENLERGILFTPPVSGEWILSFRTDSNGSSEEAVVSVKIEEVGALT